MKRLFLVAALVGCLAVPALADLSTHPLVGAPGSLLSGSVHFTPIGPSTLDVDVDFAVWTPGTFSGVTLLPVPFAPFFSPAEYVYAYQVHNLPASHALTTFGIDSAGGSLTGLAYDPDFDPAVSDVAPYAGSIFVGTPDFAEFYFSAIPAPGFSTVLLMSSPLAPAFASASVINLGQTAAGTLPSPVPGPAAVVLGTLGLGLVGWLKKRYIQGA